MALYLVALSAFQRRNLGTVNRPRLVTAAIMIALTPAATVLPALLVRSSARVGWEKLLRTGGVKMTYGDTALGGGFKPLLRDP